MNIHNFNSNTKSWKMYTNTLTSISGDDLLVMPSYGKDIILEVSANNDIFFKKGTITKRFDNLVSDYLETSFNSLNSRVQYILQEISGNSVKDFITSGISNDLLIKSYDGRDIILEVSGNSEIIFKRGDFSYNLDDLIGGGGSQSSDYATYNILDITGKIIFTDNSGTSGTSGTSGSSSNIILTSISGDIIPSINNTFKLGDVSKNWSNAYITDISATNIELSGNLNVVGATKLANTLEISGNVTFGGSNLYVPSSFTIDPIGHGNNTGTVTINGNLVVQGVTTTINSSVLDISDKMIVLASNASNSLQADGAGFEISGANVNFLYNNSSATFRSSIGISISGNVVPVTNSVGSLGETGKIWDIAYIRELNVTNFTNSIDGAKIASGTITSTQIMNGTILGTDISNDTITGANIAHGTLQAIHISNDTISGAKIAHGTLQSIHIENGTIMDVDISTNAAIAFSKINTTNAIINSDISNSAAIAFSKINASLAITDSHISASAAISGSKIANTTITAAQIANNTISAAQIANNSITSDKINQANNWTFSQLTANNLTINTINGAAYSAGGGGGSTDLTSITSNVVPSTTKTYNLGSTTNYWNNAYINNLKVSNRVYQEISGDISWSAVNGYYGLAKDAYPSLNPLSSGAKAISTWTNYSNPFIDPTSVCWSPKHQIFVCVSHHATSRGAISRNGRVWTTTLPFSGSGTEIDARDICWSPELEKFVVVASASSTNAVATSNDGITWNTVTTGAPVANWWSVCWSAELGLFVSPQYNSSNVMISKDGVNWNVITAHSGLWRDICWSAELKIFVAVGGDKVMTSSNGTNWDIITTLLTDAWNVCWSPQLGIFVAIAQSGTYRVITSSNGINWTPTTNGVTANPWSTITWCPQIMLFIVVSFWGNAMTSSNGIKWTFVNTGNLPEFTYSGCWSPDLGIFIAIGEGRTINSSLKGRPPTSYNVFDSSFNSIDETGKWTFSNMDVTTLTVTLSFTNNSDDRVKHNEVIINNGLDVIDKLTPKFYQKTLDLLDLSYNGDLSGHTWIYEAGLIAQEVLQVPDLSFAVSGGDYYESVMQYDLSYNDLSYNDLTRPSRRGNYYEVSKNLIKQSYGLNYNSVFVYGLAAIKELHQKVKAQETSISTLQTSMLEQQATINSLLTRLQALETNAN